MKNKNKIHSVTAGGGLVYQKKGAEWEILLIFRNGRWDLPKGAQEKDESIEECARREVAEETGIDEPEIQHFLTKTTHSYRRESRNYQKTTSWYAMKIKGEQKFRPQREEGIEQVSWFSLNKAEKMVGYKNLEKVIQVFKKSE
jgi:8-oxo-dGTP pyrophosphatase MutT (NUDIX family)